MNPADDAEIPGSTTQEEEFASHHDDVRGVLEPLEPDSRKPGGPVARRIYTTGNPRLDRLVNDTVMALQDETPEDAIPASPADLELVRETLTSAIRLVLLHATRAELKMINASLKEFAYSFRVFAPYRHLPKVSIFGSARVEPGDRAYVSAREFARKIAQLGWMVITGAGPGIMAAGHEGAGPEHSFGANIRLPGLNPANVYIANDGKLVNFKYFFTRKVTFLKESKAFVLMPGGWGTLDEAFELLTLIQTGKSEIHPVVLLEPEGSTYWQRWLEFNRDELLGRHFIRDYDFSIFRIARTPDQAIREIMTFYRNYRSARFVGERLILRMKRAPDTAELSRLGEEFADLLDHGSFEVIRPTSQERRDADALDSERLAFYPKHQYGRIRQLIDALNELAVPETN
jgi:uncharacterized protein (TIGR00730 family)